LRDWSYVAGVGAVWYANLGVSGPLNLLFSAYTGTGLMGSGSGSGSSLGWSHSKFRLSFIQQ
jgi:hypothetical protein